MEYQVIVFHGPKCPDGMTSAWIIWRLLTKDIRNILLSFEGIYGSINKNSFKNVSKFYNSDTGAKIVSQVSPIVFVYSQPGQEIEESIIKDKNVLILDLDMGKELARIINLSKKTLIIDHHFTSLETMEEIKNNEEIPLNKYEFYVKIETEHSGASLTWQYFNDEEIPWFINIVRIGDTFTFEEDKTAKPVLTYLYNKGVFLSFTNLDNFVKKATSNKIKKIYQKGLIMLKFQETLAKDSAKLFTVSKLKTKEKTYTVAYVASTLLSNEASQYIREFYDNNNNYKETLDFVAFWKYLPYNSLVLVSLRDPLKIDDIYQHNLGEIAKNICDFSGNPCNGGGGHISAAAFNFTGIENFHNFFPIIN